MNINGFAAQRSDQSPFVEENSKTEKVQKAAKKEPFAQPQIPPRGGKSVKIGGYDGKIKNITIILQPIELALLDGMDPGLHQTVQDATEHAVCSFSPSPYRDWFFQLLASTSPHGRINALGIVNTILAGHTRKENDANLQLAADIFHNFPRNAETITNVVRILDEKSILISKEERDNLCRLAPFIRGLECHEVEKIYSAIRAIPSDIREKVLNEVKPFLTHASTALDRSFLIYFFERYSMPKDMVADILKLRLFRSEADFNQAADCIFTLQKMDPLKRMLLLNQLLPIFKGITSGAFYLFDKILTIPSQKRRSLLAEAKDVLPLFQNGFFVRDLIIELLDREQNRSDFLHAVRCAKPLFEHCQQDEMILVTTLFAIKQSERQKTVLLVQPLLEKTKNPVIISSLLKAFANCEEDKKDDLKDAISHAMPYMQNNDHKELVEAICTIAAPLRERVLANARPFLEDNRFLEAPQIITNVAAIHPDDWQNVQESAEPFLESFETNCAKTALLKSIAAIPCAQRKSVLQTCRPYLDETSDIEQAEQIIKTIALKDENEWQSIERAAASLKGLNDPFTIRWEMLVAISEIPEQTRSQALSIAIPYLKNLKYREFCAKYIFASQAIMDEWNEIERDAAPFLEKVPVDDFELARINLYLAIHKQKKSCRKELLEHVASFGLHNQNIDLLIELLDEIAEHFDKDESLSLVASIRQVVLETVDIDLIIRLMQELSEIPPPSREPLFLSMQDALQEAASLDQRETIFYSAIHQLDEFLGYSIRFSRQEIAENPAAVLAALVQKFESENEVKDHLYVRFTGDEQAIDASGPSKEFITLLFDSLKNAPSFEKLANGLCLPKGPLTDAEKTTYQNIGKLFMFLLNAKIEHPIGMIFDESFFSAVTKLKSSHLHKPFEKLAQDPKCFQELIEIYVAMNGSDKDMLRLREYAKPYTKRSSPEIVQEAFSFACLDYDDLFEKLGITKESVEDHRRDVQKAVHEFIINSHLIPHLKPYLLPAIEVVKGMIDSIFPDKNWRCLEAEELSNKLQGKFTKEHILSHLKFIDVVPEKQKWLTDWIELADEQLLKKLIMAMTGSTSIPSTISSLNIESVNSICFQTCFSKASLPFDLLEDQQSFNETLNDALGLIGTFNTE